MTETPPQSDANPADASAPEAEIASDAPTADDVTSSPRRWRGILAWTLVVLGTVLLLLASFNLWVKRQALETDAWVEASGEFLADETIRGALAIWMVDELYSNVDLSDDLAELVPEGDGVGDVVGPLVAAATPVVQGLVRDVSIDLAERLLASSEVQQLWEEANRVAHTALVAVLDGKEIEGVIEEDGDVILSLQPILQELGDRAGVDLSNADIPEDFGQITVLEDGKLDTVRTLLNALRVLSVLLGLVVIGMFGLAIFINRGHRRRMLLASAGGVLLVGILLLLIQEIAGNAFVEALSEGEVTLEPLTIVWGIGTGLLVNIATLLIVYGVIALIAAMLAGPSRPAVAIRRWLAPHFRERALVVYASAVFLMLLALLWSPTGTSRELGATAVLAVLILFGVKLLGRQSLREFPEGDAAVSDTLPAQTASN